MSDGNQERPVLFKDKNIYIVFKKKDKIITPKLKQSKHAEYTTTLMTYVHHILSNQNIADLSFEKIYRLCYKICIEKGGKCLSEKLSELLSVYLKETYENEIYYLYYNDYEYFKRIIEKYNYFIEKIDIIQKTLMYYETYYLKRNQLNCIKEEAKNIFYSIIIADSSEKAVKLLILLIENNRRQDPGDCSFIFKLMEMIIDLNESFVVEHLKDSLLKNQELYYNKLYRTTIMQKDFEESIDYVTSCYQDEVNHINEYNLIVLKDDLIDIFFKEIILPLIYGNGSIEEILKTFIFNKNIGCICKIYSLTKISKGKEFLELISKLIESIGKNIINELKNLNDQLILTVIGQLYDFLKTINTLSTSLQIDNKLYWEELLKNHITSLVNSSNHIIAKILPKYVDIAFTLSIKPSMASSINVNPLSINDIIYLFKFVKDKGLFELHYRKFLGYRLLTNMYQESQERVILSRIMAITGSMYIRKCETMLNDIKESSDSVSKYGNESSAPFKIDFGVKILTSGNWELKRDDTIRHDNIFISNESFNNEFSHIKCIQLMKGYFEYYFKYHPNTVINHYLYLGKCEVNAMINNKTYLLVLSPIQSLFMILFNKSNSKRKVTLDELMKIFTVKDKDRLIDHLKPLVMNQLIYFENGTYSFNKDYTNKASKFIVNFKNELIKGSVEENEGNQMLQKQRNIIIESIIIKTMKEKMKMTHANLMNELLNNFQSNFVPDVTTIKNRIEILIERGYLSRDVNELNTYQYIA